MHSRRGGSVLGTVRSPPQGLRPVETGGSCDLASPVGLRRARPAMAATTEPTTDKPTSGQTPTRHSESSSAPTIAGTCTPLFAEYARFYTAANSWELGISRATANRRWQYGIAVIVSRLKRWRVPRKRSISFVVE